MNNLGLLLLGAAARGAALVVVGLGLGWAFRRKGPAAAATLAFATLVSMVGISALGASPWPRWFDVTPPARVETADRTDVLVTGAIGSTSPPGGLDPGDPSLPVAKIEAPDSGIAGALRLLGRVMLSPSVSEPEEGWRWPAWIAVAAVVGVGFGIGRFALGLAAVAALRRSSRPLDDPDLLELATILRQRLGVRRPVELRLEPGLAMPATIGWRRPVILLPPDWSGWDDRERRVVLSHELAHIRRDDYLAGIGAQLSLALQFYHPLAHWLAGRHRLGQELAADAWGAQLSGGNRPYLTALARLALRNEPRPVGWAARSFSPARGTFLRRIEMLRDARELSPAPLSRRSRAMALGGLALAVLTLAGFRAAGPHTEVLAAMPAQEGGDALAGGYIPADAGMVAVIRPAEMMISPDLKRLLESFDAQRRAGDRRVVSPLDAEQITLVWLAGDAKRDTNPSGTIIRTTRPQDWKAHAAEIIGAETEEVRFGETTYVRQTGGMRSAYAAVDDRTILLAEEPVLLRMLVARPGATEGAPWAEAWKGIKKGQMAVAIDPSWLLGKLQPMIAGRPAGAGSPFDGFEPLLSKAHGYAVGVDLLQGIRVDGIASCNTDPGAKQVADTIRAGLTLARNTLASTRGLAARDGQSEAKILLDLADPVLEVAEVKVEGRTVRLTAASPLKPGQFAAALAPAVQAQRSSAKRMQSINNMKQIGLAFHNYAQAHDGRFPTSVMIGPDGKTPYSWRVAVLPYLEQNELYKQYNFNEPWDGPNNRKLLDKMPPTFLHPDGDRKSSSYYMPSNPRAMGDAPGGGLISSITDGLSYTIALVEARRDIPWTKPEDIPVPVPADGPNAPLPKLGGFAPDIFNALFSDGAVRTIKNSIAPDTLKAFFSKDGGEVIQAF